MINEDRKQRYADELYSALCDRRVVAPLTDREPEIDLADAYAIQMRLVELRIRNRQERVVGKKIGVTSEVVQKALAVDQPDFGHLLSGMAFENRATLEMGSLIQPRAEGEIAFFLCSDLQGPGVTPDAVLEATESVAACFEIVDSRIRDWKIRIQDTVADNASSAAFVIGDERVSPRTVDLERCRMSLERNGQAAGGGTGTATLGSPLVAVAWLANTLGGLGIALRAGEVILSGSLGPLLPATAGDRFRVSIEGIGSAEVHFA